MPTDTLQKAIELIKSGEKISGGKILYKLVKEEPDNELAWLWFSTCCTEKSAKEHCLREALRINPQNQTTQKALEKLLAIPSPSLEEITANSSSQQPYPSSNKSNNKESVHTKSNVGAGLAFSWIIRGAKVILVLILAAGMLIILFGMMGVFR